MAIASPGKRTLSLGSSILGDCLMVEPSRFLNTPRTGIVPGLADIVSGQHADDAGCARAGFDIDALDRWRADAGCGRNRRGPRPASRMSSV